MNQKQAAIAVGVSLVTLFSLAAWTRQRKSSPKQSTPPGPKPDWLIANLRHLPRDHFYEKFTEWQKDYGDLIYVSALGTGMLIVNDLEVARDLTVKRGAIYSGRPQFIMISDLIGWSWVFTFGNPGPRHTEGRKVIHQSLGPNTVSKYDFIITSELEKLIHNIKNAPDEEQDVLEVVRGAISAIMVRTTYGDGVFEEIGEKLIQVHHEAIKMANWIAGQFWPVENLPILQYLPSWLPGVQFKDVAKRGRVYQEAVRYDGFENALVQFKNGKLGTCIAGEYLTEASTAKEKDSLRDTLGVMFGAGVDTTTYTIVIFVAAILSHPDIQAKIKKELDTYLHETSKHLPSPSDLAHLPYLRAAWKESIRWIPTMALAIPHLTLQEDVYKQWYIPKDTIVFLNAGFMCRDPKIWDEPEKYKPERWLEEYNPNASQLPDVYDVAFGFGRRVCPGKHLAERMGLSFVAGLLSMYDIVPLEGEPVPAPDSFTYSDMNARYPENLRCRFRAR